jgi:regulator of replication initiation timing
MWISKASQQRLDEAHAAAGEVRRMVGEVAGECKRLEIENTRLRADLDWFKLRLNSVEKERAQLIAAAIGVKISVPEFVPQMDNPAEALNHIPDLTTIGNDAVEDYDMAAIGQEQAVDYSMMPGYRKR